ncbi:penicillin-binding protein 2 [Hephaestia mangrovi]|uniref:penicillin-binding protein 2 n=1 Tax=Hephaestia mangrovi TaxID=2873268 RepID=UPI001CA719FD|nr:penicillin-binding protein 2 [Hephaestia mangrovi]MBY8827757.1 penicillin-binding protein 2 [Hephaestia mangrovi]
MKRPTRIVTEAAQTYSFSRRAVFLGGAQATVGAVLAGRMAWLSIAENQHYELLSESNRVNLTMIPPRRGWIIDRYGKPIANNRTDFRVDIIPDQLQDKDRVLGRLQAMLLLSDETMERIRADLKQAAGFQPVEVADKLDYEQFARIYVHWPELPGVAPTQGYARNYPAGAAVAHLTGYVGAASAEQYEKTHNPLLITPGFKIGKDGLEKTLESRLEGKPGAKRVEVTARGKIVRQLATRPDTPGQNVRLAIDLGLQEYAARRLGTNSGSAVVLDCLTGDVLAMCSMPAYDPNVFSEGISHLEWNMLSDNDHVPLMNKVLQGLYPPGSTVKTMDSLALLRAGVTPQDTVNCTGVIRVGTGLFHCWKRGGHGPISMRRAVAQSCDIYFWEMARRVGYDNIAPTARELGLGQTFDIPFSSQRYGTVPDSEWKMKKYHHPWTVADTLNAAIGQGYMLVNPLQLAVMAARLASGRNIQPRVLLDHPHGAAPFLSDVQPEHIATVRDAMYAAVNDGGTAARARMLVPGVTLAAKTGTAQVRRITMADRRAGRTGNAGVPFKLREHALFICFAPADNPRYAASIVLEHNGHLIANLDAHVTGRDIMTYLFDRDRALKSLAEIEPTWGGDIRTRMAQEEAVYRAAHQVPELLTTKTDAGAATASSAVENAAAATNAAVEAVGGAAAQSGSPEDDQ